jgi:peptidoglycan/LPS O-acetylase OafA/YrhL
VAIAGVLICHASESLLASQGVSANSAFQHLASYGAKGVDLFFALSGFLITNRLLREEKRLGFVGLKGFYIRRLFRILPPYLLFVAVLAFLGGAGLIRIGFWEGVASLAFFRNYLPESSGGCWYTGHFWSLSVEEHFYLLWPGLLALAASGRRRCLVAALSAGLIGLWRSVEFRWQVLDSIVPGVGFFTRTDIRLDALLWGCWFALLWDVPLWRARLSHLLSSWLWPCLVLSYGVLLVADLHLSLSAQAFLMPLLIVGTLARPGRLAGLFLELPLLKWIGRLSYSLYLWQQLFLVADHPATPSFLSAWQVWPVNVLATFVCAGLSYYLVERPMIRCGHRLADPADRPDEYEVADAADRLQHPVAL